MKKIINGWNTDMGSAPRGESVKVGERAVRGNGVAAINKFEKAYILLSFIDKGVPKVISTYRTEGSRMHPDGYWAGLADTQEPLGWMHLPQPLLPLDVGK